MGKLIAELIESNRSTRGGSYETCALIATVLGEASTPERVKEREQVAKRLRDRADEIHAFVTLRAVEIERVDAYPIDSRESELYAVEVTAAGLALEPLLAHALRSSSGEVAFHAKEMQANRASAMTTAEIDHRHNTAMADCADGDAAAAAGNYDKAALHYVAAALMEQTLADCVATQPARAIFARSAGWLWLHAGEPVTALTTAGRALAFPSTPEHVAAELRELCAVAAEMLGHRAGGPGEALANLRACLYAKKMTPPRVLEN